MPIVQLVAVQRKGDPSDADIFLLSCSETKCNIVLRMHALVAPLIAVDRVKMVKIGLVVFELKWGIENENCAATQSKL